MTDQKLEYLRQKIDQLFIDQTTEHKTVLQILEDAVRQIRQIAGAGGANRVLGEQAIVDLIKDFDTTRGDRPWPLSKYMMGHQENVQELAILSQYRFELAEMSLKEMEQELELVTSQIDEDVPWQEALSVAIRRYKGE